VKGANDDNADHRSIAATEVCDIYLSVVIPAHNEEACVEPLAIETLAVLGRLARPVELIFIDDASTDSTLAHLRRLKAADPRVRVLALKRRIGQSGALVAGWRCARGSLVACLDADLQNDPNDLPKMLQLLEDRPDLVAVVGRRVRRRDSGVRRVSSCVANRIGRWINRESGNDAGCALKVCRAHRLAALPDFDGLHRFICPLLSAREGDIAEVDVNHRPRLRGKSKYGHGLGRTLRVLVDAAGVRWLKSRRLPIEGSELL
jgi:dolichol-phosphate mannosyltransferase